MTAQFPSITPTVQATLYALISILATSSIILFGVKKIAKPPKIKFNYMYRTLISLWKILSLLLLVVLSSKTIAIIVIGAISFGALRELLSTLALRFSDRRAMFWCYLAIPIQFYCVYISYYRLFIVFIPVVMFMVLPFRNVLTGNTRDITRSTAVIQWSLMLSVFSLSHLAYLLVLKTPESFSVGNEGYILYLLILTSLSDLLGTFWSHLLGKRKLAPKINPNRTWEGFIGALISTALLGYAFRFLTPFTPLQSLIAGFCISLAGIAGDLNISAIKRDLGLKSLNHSKSGGIMDRLDSLSFTALAFFHLTHLWTVA